MRYKDGKKLSTERRKIEKGGKWGIKVETI